MLSEKLRSIRTSLEGVPQASQMDATDIVRSILRELDAAAEQAEDMETALIVPDCLHRPLQTQNLWEAMRDGRAD